MDFEDDCVANANFYPSSISGRIEIIAFGGVERSKKRYFGKGEKSKNGVQYGTLFWRH